jgi:hypothetical protein
MSLWEAFERNNEIKQEQRVWKGHGPPKYSKYQETVYPRFFAKKLGLPELNHQPLQSKLKFVPESEPENAELHDPLSETYHCAHSNERDDSLVSWLLV